MAFHDQKNSLDPAGGALYNSSTDPLVIIEDVIGRLRPMVVMHGGDIKFVSYENGIVTVRLHGACVGCPASYYTLTHGFEQALREALPEMRELVALEE